MSDPPGQTRDSNTPAARQRNPRGKGSVGWLAWIVARLGGSTGYYKPREPKTVAIGCHLAAMLAGFAIATPALADYGADVWIP